MSAVKSAVADNIWVANERQTAATLTKEENESAAFDAANNLHWLNEHIAEIWSTPNPFNALKTPGKLRGVKTPAFIRDYGTFTAPPVKNILPLTTADLENLDTVPVGSADLPFVFEMDEPMPYASENVSENVSEHASEETGNEDNEPTPKQQQQQEQQQQQQQSPVQLYTESDIGSPSVHATPEKPLRKGSFSFAPLPARDPLKQSLGVQTIEQITATVDIKPANTMATSTRPSSLGLDTDVEDESDDESMDLRAPELIAHDERMKSLESSPMQPEYAEHDHFESAATSPVPAEKVEIDAMVESDDEIMHEPHQQMAVPVAPRIETIENTESHEEATTDAPKPTAAKEPHRATKTAIGRPVRPTLSNKPKPQPQPVPIKIKSTFTAKPINTAPVAAHNQDATKVEAPKNELKRKPSTQFTTPGPAKKPTAPLKVFAVAQKKKEADEAKAAKEAAAAQAMRERRDATIAARRQAEKAAEDEASRKAREDSAEKVRRHATGVEAADKFRDSAERSQEREEAECNEKKQKFRRSQELRATKPVAAPSKTVLKCAIKPSLKVPPKIKPGQLKRTAPPRPPTRTETHETTRPASRLEKEDDRHDTNREDNLPSYPSNLSKPPVRASSIKKPSIFSNSIQGLANFPQPPSKGGLSMQQYATQRIPFANEPAAPLQQHHHNMNTQPARPMSKQGLATPYTGMQSMHTIQAINETSPSEATLPEIHTDSSDDSHADAKSLASWATPGHLRAQLENQENLNADMVFPRIPTLSMEEVFQNNPRMARLRNRTSSAHWVRNGDALTEYEIKKDQDARKAIKDAKGWTYGVEK